MTHEPSNIPTPDNLLLTARESLKSVLREPEADHSYTILMAMNAMGIAARAMQADSLPPAHPGISDDAFRCWVRQADHAAVMNPELIDSLRRHVIHKLAVSNPRFAPESTQDNP